MSGQSTKGAVVESTPGVSPGVLYLKLAIQQPFCPDTRSGCCPGTVTGPGFRDPGVDVLEEGSQLGSGEGGYLLRSHGARLLFFILKTHSHTFVGVSAGVYRGLPRGLPRG